MTDTPVVRTVDQTVGEVVRERREQLGYSQSALARLLRNVAEVPFHDTTVARTEAGTRPMRLNEAAAVCRVLRCDVGWLLTPAGDRAAAESDLRTAMPSASELTIMLAHRGAVPPVDPVDAARAEVEQLRSYVQQRVTALNMP